MLKKMLISLLWLFPVLIAVIASARAADIAHDVRSGDGGQEQGGYFEVGVSLAYDHNPLAQLNGESNNNSGFGLELAGAYFYKGFFIELAHGTYDGLNLGYQLGANDAWKLDLIATSLDGSYTTGDDSDNPDEALLDRDSLYNGAGFRLTRYAGPYVLQGRLVSDIHDNNGVSASARLGRNWQVRNWNFHSIASLDYASGRTLNYYLGVTDEEATARFPAYTAKHGTAVSIEVGATLPVSQNLVWRSAFMHTIYSDEVTDSPLFDRDNYTGLNTSLSYVF